MTEGVKVFDSSGTELDDDVFEDVVKDPSAGVLTIKYETGMSQLNMSFIFQFSMYMVVPCG